MEENRKNPKMNKGFASINLAIAGYDDVPDPIYEIMEIRAFYHRLYKKVPYFLFYVSPINKIPYYILCCLADIDVKARSGAWKSPIQLAKETGSMEAIGETTVEVRLDGEIGYSIIEAIQAHAEKIGFVDDHVELPIMYKIIEGMIKVEERENKYINE